MPSQSVLWRGACLLLRWHDETGKWELGDMGNSNDWVRMRIGDRKSYKGCIG